MIDWLVVATIAAPLVAAFLGAWVNRRLESRPILLSHFGHVSGLTLERPEGPVTVNTHSVVIRNAGRWPATNVKVAHYVLPDFNVWPLIRYDVEDLPQRGKEIVIPVLAPGEQLTISYLYFGPTTVQNINAGVKCDQGIAKPIPMLLQRQYPKWWTVLAAAIFLAGIIAVVYLFYELAQVVLNLISPTAF